MTSRLKGLQARFPCIGDVRGLGAMVAIELVKNRRADSPDADLTKALVKLTAKRWFTAAAANQPFDQTMLTVTIGTRCFAKSATKKVD